MRKYKLNPARALLYINYNFKGTNALSDEILNLINFEKGSFFALLPNDAHIEKILEFKTGGILSQNPIQECCISGKKSYYSITPTIREESPKRILKEIKQKELNCIFDDVNSSSTDKNDNLIDINGIFYED